MDADGAEVAVKRKTLGAGGPEGMIFFQMKCLCRLATPPAEVADDAHDAEDGDAGGFGNSRIVELELSKDGITVRSRADLDFVEFDSLEAKPV
jgi:hypothetical protein